MHALRLLAALAVLVSVSQLLAKDPALKDVLSDDLVSDAWIYDDLEKGYAEAKKTGKPLLVAFSCVP